MKNTTSYYYIFIALLFGFCLGVFANYDIANQAQQKLLDAQKEQVKEVIYLEIPCFIQEDSEEEALQKEEELFMAYFDLKTEENREYWWQGYQIMEETLTVKPLQIEDVFSEEDLEYFYRCVETETYGADFNSKVNVANVILNRLYNDKFGDTLKDVITAPNQFAYSRTTISLSTIQACAYAYEIEDTTEGALFFHSGAYTETFNGASYIFTDSVGHHFYK